MPAGKVAMTGEVVTVRKVSAPGNCPVCDDEDLQFLFGTAAGSLSVCSHCGMLQVEIVGTEGDFEKRTSYWYQPVDATTEDFDDEEEAP